MILGAEQVVLVLLGKIDRAPWSDFQDLKLLLDILEPARIVGGAVRNSLLNIPISDIDIATIKSPEEVIKIASNAGFKVIPTGLQHGTVTCVKDRAYEVTTLRIDVETDGRHAKVQFAESWEEDANRRDFTINALYSDYYGNIYDYVNGITDIKNKVLRFIGNPEARIQEDYLRILRFFRFLAHYCDHYDEESLSACISLGHNLKNISRERCTSEFMKLLDAKDPTISLKLISQEILGSAGLPSITNTTLNEINSTFNGHFLSLIGKLSTFGKIDEMKLSRKDRGLLKALQDLEYMEEMNQYTLWINTANEKIVWDGIILKGKNKEKFTGFFDKWMKNKFELTGKDLIKIGHPAGPNIGSELKKILTFFCNQPEPLPKERLIELFYNRINEED